MKVRDEITVQKVYANGAVTEDVEVNCTLTLRFKSIVPSVWYQGGEKPITLQEIESIEAENFKADPSLFVDTVFREIDHGGKCASMFFEVKADNIGTFHDG